MALSSCYRYSAAHSSENRWWGCACLYFFLSFHTGLNMDVVESLFNHGGQGNKQGEMSWKKMGTQNSKHYKEQSWSAKHIQKEWREKNQHLVYLLLHLLGFLFSQLTLTLQYTSCTNSNGKNIAASQCPTTLKISKSYNTGRRFAWPHQCGKDLLCDKVASGMGYLQSCGESTIQTKLNLEGGFQNGLGRRIIQW